VVSLIKGLVLDFDARLTVDERNLLSIAYKNITNALRTSWRVADTLEKLESSRPNSASRHAALARRQRERIERELANACKDLVDLLDGRLLLLAQNGEETVFYLKMKADYYRYLAEFSLKRDRERYADLSLNAYKMAYKHALSTLEPTHPTRLGLALNFSVYYHDVYRSPERASHLAKHAFDEAIESLEQSSTPQDSLMILQLLRDDLILWAAEMLNESK